MWLIDVTINYKSPKEKGRSDRIICEGAHMSYKTISNSIRRPPPVNKINMALRRPPTRIELKSDDVEEYDKVILWLVLSLAAAVLHHK